MSLVSDPNHIRLAMLGMVDENGHPYSWSAILNGYDPEQMAHCGFPPICHYLAAEPAAAFGIEGTRVTHVWCDDPADAKRVAAASLIPNIVDRPEDVIGEVDAVLIPTDIGHEHVDRARPFVEAGLPVFVDKPMVDNADDLRQFVAWVNEGKPIMSSSGLRYSGRFGALRDRIGEVGELRMIVMGMCNSWERYAIHAIESVYPFLEPGGWTSVSNTGTATANVAHLTHQSGVDVSIIVNRDMVGGYGHMTVYGTTGQLSARFDDSFVAFKAQLVDFVSFLKTGDRPYHFDETIELMKLVIGGIRSRNDGGRRVALSEFAV
jgi:predicted dehydrogenase